MKKLVNSDIVKHVAKLARLNVAVTESEKYAEHLSGILQYVETLQQIDTKNVEPLYSPAFERECFLREDHIHASIEREDLLRNAPQRELNQFKIQAVLEDDL
ncbi:MAG: Asp-tRNA(Asn)/Glu-tRNA(Gln) amidotransferase subunit GatC [Bacteriovoracaceae bacterium]|nr:Asp-tRNA(Asn)/Glu-tRNA(Gln) amidotransferase subunit GatC [Bacteriovoracaceae bacterium]